MNINIIGTWLLMLLFIEACQGNHFSGITEQNFPKEQQEEARSPELLKIDVQESQQNEDIPIADSRPSEEAEDLPGYYIFCNPNTSTRKTEETYEIDLSCAVAETDQPNVPLNMNEHFRSWTWSYQNLSTNVSISINEPSSYSDWHVDYTFKGVTIESIQQSIANTGLQLQAETLDGKSGTSETVLQGAIVDNEIEQLEVVQEKSDIAISVAIRFGGKQGNNQLFSLYLTSSSGDLSQIEKVIYHIHPTFSSEYWTANDPNEQFATGVYSTYSNNWRTLGTRIFFKDGSMLELPGTLIKWP